MLEMASGRNFRRNGSNTPAALTTLFHFLNGIASLSSIGCPDARFVCGWNYLDLVFSFSC